MLIEFLTSRFFFIIPMLFGGMAFWFLLRLMSLSVGVTWREIWSELLNGNEAVAKYFGLRAIAVAVLVGLISIAGAIV